MREICREAEVSPGLLRHYFDGKEDAVVSALRALTAEIDETLYLALGPETVVAEDRLKSFVAAFFSGGLTRPATLGAYLALWTLARTDPAVRRLRRAAYRRQQSRLEPVLRRCAKDRGVRIDARRQAIGLIALLDGLWLELCLDPKAFSRQAAHAMAWSWLDAALGRRRKSP